MVLGIAVIGSPSTIAISRYWEQRQRWVGNPVEASGGSFDPTSEGHLS